MVTQPKVPILQFTQAIHSTKSFTMPSKRGPYEDEQPTKRHRRAPDPGERIQPKERRIPAPAQQETLLPTLQGQPKPRKPRSGRVRLADTENLVPPHKEANPDVLQNPAAIARYRTNVAKMVFPNYGIQYSDAMRRESERGPLSPAPPIDPIYSRREQAPKRDSPLPAPKPKRIHRVVIKPPVSPAAPQAQTRQAESPPPVSRATKYR